MLEFLVASFTIILMCVVVIYQCDEVEKLEELLKEEKIRVRIGVQSYENLDKRFSNYITNTHKKAYYDKANDTVVDLNEIIEIGEL